MGTPKIGMSREFLETRGFCKIFTETPDLGTPLSLIGGGAFWGHEDGKVGMLGTARHDLKMLDKFGSVKA